MELRWMGGRTVRLSGQDAKALLEPQGTAASHPAGGLLTYSLAAPSTTGGPPASATSSLPKGGPGVFKSASA